MPQPLPRKLRRLMHRQWAKTARKLLTARRQQEPNLPPMNRAERTRHAETMLAALASELRAKTPEPKTSLESKS
jgi:hypothetical protein